MNSKLSKMCLNLWNKFFHQATESCIVSLNLHNAIFLGQTHIESKGNQIVKWKKRGTDVQWMDSFDRRRDDILCSIYCTCKRMHQMFLSTKEKLLQHKTFLEPVKNQYRINVCVREKREFRVICLLLIYYQTNREKQKIVLCVFFFF
jgi:hypothetical protein